MFGPMWGGGFGPGFGPRWGGGFWGPGFHRFHHFHRFHRFPRRRWWW